MNDKNIFLLEGLKNQIMVRLHVANVFMDINKISTDKSISVLKEVYKLLGKDYDSIYPDQKVFIKSEELLISRFDDIINRYYIDSENDGAPGPINIEPLLIVAALSGYRFKIDFNGRAIMLYDDDQEGEIFIIGDEDVERLVYIRINESFNWLLILIDYATSENKDVYRSVLPINPHTHNMRLYLETARRYERLTENELITHFVFFLSGKNQDSRARELINPTLYRGVDIKDVNNQNDPYVAIKDIENILSEIRLSVGQLDPSTQYRILGNIINLALMGYDASYNPDSRELDFEQIDTQEVISIEYCANIALVTNLLNGAYGNISQEIISDILARAKEIYTRWNRRRELREKIAKENNIGTHEKIRNCLLSTLDFMTNHDILSSKAFFNMLTATILINDVHPINIDKIDCIKDAKDISINEIDRIFEAIGRNPHTIDTTTHGDPFISQDVWIQLLISIASLNYKFEIDYMENIIRIADEDDVALEYRLSNKTMSELVRARLDSNLNWILLGISSAISKLNNRQYSLYTISDSIDALNLFIGTAAIYERPDELDMINHIALITRDYRVYNKKHIKRYLELYTNKALDDFEDSIYLEFEGQNFWQYTSDVWTTAPDIVKWIDDILQNEDGVLSADPGILYKLGVYFIHLALKGYNVSHDHLEYRIVFTNVCDGDTLYTSTIPTMVVGMELFSENKLGKIYPIISKALTAYREWFNLPNDESTESRIKDSQSNLAEVVISDENIAESYMPEETEDPSAPMVYVAGDILNEGSAIVRDMEKRALIDMGYRVFSPKDDAEINDKINQTVETNNRLAEKILYKDTLGLFESDIILIEPASHALGTHVELGQILGMKDLADEIISMIKDYRESALPTKTFIQNLDTYAKTIRDKKVYAHIGDIRCTDIPEVGFRRSFSVNQYVHGAALKLTNGEGFLKKEEIYKRLEELLKNK